MISSPFVIGDSVARTVTLHLRPSFGDGRTAQGHRIVGGGEAEVADVLREAEHAVREMIEGRSSRCMSFTVGRDDPAELLARDLCTAAGVDPEADILPFGMAFQVTARGDQIVNSVPTRKAWTTYVGQARGLIEAGWRKVGAV